MLFSDAIEALNQDKISTTIDKAAKAVFGGDGWKFDEKTSLIYEISKSKMKVQFFPIKTKIIFGDEEIDITLTDFSKITFKESTVKDDSGTDIIMSSLFYDGMKKFEDTEEKMESYKSLVSVLSEVFENDDMTPKKQVEQLIEDFELNENSSYRPDFYKLLLFYKDRMEDIFNNDFLHKNSKVLLILEENSGNLTENLGKTVTKGLGNAILGGAKGLVGFGMGLAKVAGSKVGHKVKNSTTDSNSIIILTDKNVILAKQGDINEYDFDDAFEIFEARQDETFVGIVDVYDDCENKILENIAQTKWNSFKNQLRKIKKDTEQIGFSGGENFDSKEEADDEFAEAEKKITKLKKLLDNGLISQEDFNAKKAEILSAL